MIHKRVLVTECIDKDGRPLMLYGRYDAVKLASGGIRIVNSHFEYYRMTEETFVLNAEKEIKK